MSIIEAYLQNVTVGVTECPVWALAVTCFLTLMAVFFVQNAIRGAERAIVRWLGTMNRILVWILKVSVFVLKAEVEAISELVAMAFAACRGGAV
jgi:hypothetical protein